MVVSAVKRTEVELLASLQDLRRKMKILQRESDIEKGISWQHLEMATGSLQAAVTELLHTEDPSALIETGLQVWGEQVSKALREAEVGEEAIEVKRTGIALLAPQTVRRALTPWRIQILELLRQQRVSSAARLAQLTERSPAAISRDLKVLYNLGFIGYEPRGKRKEPVLLTEGILILLSTSARGAPAGEGATHD